MATNMTEQTRMGPKPPVAVKGVRDGLLFLLNDRCSFDELLHHLHDLLTGVGSSLFDGPEIPVFVDYGERALTRSQSQALLTEFLQKENFILQEFGAHTVARRLLFRNPTAGVKQSIYKGTVRSGQSLLFDGDVVVVGDVHPGGEIAATGDIFVFGRLHGIAHAGVEGDTRAVVGAAEFAPLQVRIADYIGHAPRAEGKRLRTFMELAYVHENGMAVGRMHFLPSLRR
ncbi:septum site-determining protein MinC [Alicyclobacillus shizuokensis]|uniref:septum site-determining protein MinC n=1 Tax=Alicyclobacillus shizuokensis TaxID=392014 RepID=UPI00083005D2|nr:septum site-determining protein MinC [Alicyclobacillus shizuokensis]MCL6625402.1 septation ring formation regulator EzrA [Alicyclobacillus shizuokensis]